MNDIKLDHVFSSPSRYAWDNFKDLDQIVKIPKPTISDLQEFSYRDIDFNGLNDASGLINPNSGNDYKNSDAYKEWASAFKPSMTVLWPCNPSIDIEIATGAIYEAGIKCSFIKGNIDGITEISGIALTEGGNDYSDHIAAAYICCGQVPPITVLLQALKKVNPIMENELFEAAEKVNLHFDDISSNLNSKLNARNNVNRSYP